MQPEDSVTGWIGNAKAGDPLAVQILWERYFEQLLRVSRAKLGGMPRRVADEEDVVLSALNSFFEGAKKGRFPQLADRHDLWQLLVVITHRKAIDQIHHQHRQKRGGGHVRGESVWDGDPDAQGPPGIQQILDREPTPEFAAQFAEQLERLLAGLADDSLRRVAQLKLEGYTNGEIAGGLGCSLRSIERKLTLIRARWSQQDARHE
jgi:DNA-directed RNA polymerase specialized sigma24 family protein